MDDLISRQTAIKAADSIIERDTSGNNDVVKAMNAWKEYIKALPPAQPEEPEVTITYQICVASMLKMWMDDVLTDSEYRRIMNKLNTWYRTEGCQEE